MESRLKPELDERYRERREEKMWKTLVLGIGLLMVAYMGIHLLAYWILQ